MLDCQVVAYNISYNKLPCFCHELLPMIHSIQSLEVTAADLLVDCRYFFIGYHFLIIQ